MVINANYAVYMADLSTLIIHIFFFPKAKW